MMKKIYVSQINNHLLKEIEESFLLRKISIKQTKNGISYAALQLEDKTGSLIAIIWDENIKEGFLDLEHKIVTVKGEVYINPSNNKHELVCWDMFPATEYQYKDYVRGLEEDEINRYFLSLNKQIHLVKHKGYRELLDIFFKEHEQDYKELPANLTKCGNYNGGLLVQTVSVTSMAIQLMRSHKLYAYQPNQNLAFQEDLLITAALLMGAGNCHLYTPFPEATEKNEYSLISKDTLTIQTIELIITKLENYVSLEDKNLLYHTIQAAYQRDKNYLMTREALLLQTAFHTYSNLEEYENIMIDNRDKVGCIYIPEKKQRIYLSKNIAEGGPSNGVKEFYKPEHLK